MAGLKINKDLDLRRYGKNLYTKALKNGGSGGDSDGDDVLSGLRAFEQSMQDKGLESDGDIPIDLYREQAEEYGLVPDYTYGNSETASMVLIFMSNEGPEGEIGVAFLTEKEYKAWSSTIFWNFNYFCGYWGDIAPSPGVNVTLQDVILMSDTLPQEWEGLPEIPVEQGYTFTIWGNVSNRISLENSELTTVIANILDNGGSISLITDAEHNNGRAAVMKVVDPYTHKVFYAPVMTDRTVIG